MQIIYLTTNPVSNNRASTYFVIFTTNHTNFYSGSFLLSVLVRVCSWLKFIFLTPPKLVTDTLALPSISSIDGLVPTLDDSGVRRRLLRYFAKQRNGSHPAKEAFSLSLRQLSSLQWRRLKLPKIRFPRMLQKGP